MDRPSEPIHGPIEPIHGEAAAAGEGRIWPLLAGSSVHGTGSAVVEGLLGRIRLHGTPPPSPQSAMAACRPLAAAAERRPVPSSAVGSRRGEGGGQPVPPQPSSHSKIWARRGRRVPRARAPPCLCTTVIASPNLGEEREEGLEDGQRCRLRKEGVREVEKTKSSIYRCARNWVFLGQRVGPDLPRRLS